MRIDNGGPAFPRPETEFTNGDEGMSLRDYFAAKSLVAIITSGTFYKGGKDETEEQIDARIAYQWADAMIAERKKER